MNQTKSYQITKGGKSTHISTKMMPDWIHQYNPQLNDSPTLNTNIEKKN